MPTRGRVVQPSVVASVTPGVFESFDAYVSLRRTGRSDDSLAIGGDRVNM